MKAGVCRIGCCRACLPETCKLAVDLWAVWAVLEGEAEQLLTLCLCAFLLTKVLQKQIARA